MTLLVFLGVLVSLLILRLIPGLLLRLVLAIPRHRLIAMMRWVDGRQDRHRFAAKQHGCFFRRPYRQFRACGGRFKLVLVSSSLLVLAVLATTAFWTWHSTGLMMLLR